MSATPHSITRADFVFGPYRASRNDRATWQMLNTLVPYLLLWWLTLRVAAVSLWLLPPLILLLSLFSVGGVSLMHDCGHRSLFRQRWLNRGFGFLLGLVNGVPKLAWSRDHADHHRTNGDWDRYRSVIDMLSVEEYLRLDPLQRRLYATLRHPLMAFPGGFFYLAIKPRLDLVSGLIASLTGSRPPRPWASPAEFHDLLLCNLVWVGGVVLLGWWQGFGLFLGIYAAVLTLSAAIFIDLFFVQHIFEDSYAHRSEGWSHLEGALRGTSLLRLPPVLAWFTADIGFHNMHHLCERIPNYQLRACHEHNQHLLADVPTLTLGTMLACASYLLWDSHHDRLVTIASVGAGQDVTVVDIIET